jgi:hypothetical protein
MTQKKTDFTPPRGMEVLIKKAAVDPAFKRLLLEKRAGAAESIDLVLDPTEVTMLATIPESQLSAIIASTTVAPRIRSAFQGCVAAVMLAALGCGTNSGSANTATTSDPGQIVPQGISPDTSYVAPKADNIPRETGTLKGKVTDQQDREIASAVISVSLAWVVIPGTSSTPSPDAPIRGMAYNPGTKEAPSRPVEASATADSDGNFLFQALPAGFYAVTAMAAGFLQWDGEAQVTANGTTEMTIQLLPKPEHNAKGGARPEYDKLTGGARPDIPKTPQLEGQ